MPRIVTFFFPLGTALSLRTYRYVYGSTVVVHTYSSELRVPSPTQHARARAPTRASEHKYRGKRVGPPVAARLGTEESNSSVAVSAVVANLNLIDSVVVEPSRRTIQNPLSRWRTSTGARASTGQTHSSRKSRPAPSPTDALARGGANPASPMVDEALAADSPVAPAEAQPPEVTALL